MAILKCKMCGGTLEVNNDATVCECEYCGTTQTLPKLNDERRANLYDRANHFRRNNDFDKAMGIYEQILNEDKTDAEAYWSLVLCRYGIEYVEDPATHKRVPTVNRAQYTSVFADEDYKAALQYADLSQKSVYEAEAKAIDEIQKGILEISNKEEPFDVFICYKETDNNGRRTPDSVLANDLYHQLTQEGFKVFFSRITLEDKLGSAYEPYIFAALNSSKVMVVIGTKPEYYNAVWVKNEWSRYLALIRAGAKKMLIPAYRDMDPYDLPDEFSHLQAQDMSKLGFMQDLIRGIKKIVGQDEPKPSTTGDTVVVQQNSNVQALLDRGNMALEDGEWQKADGFFEEVLNQDAKCGEAYLGKLLASSRNMKLKDFAEKNIQRFSEIETEDVESCAEETEHIEDVIKEKIIPNYLHESEIRDLYKFERNIETAVKSATEQYEACLASLNANKNLNRAKDYSTGQTKANVESCIKQITDTLLKKVDNAKADETQKINAKVEEYKTFIKDADTKAEALYVAANEQRESDYTNAVEQFNKAKTVEEYNAVIPLLEKIGDYKDAKSITNQCEDAILAKRAEEKKKSNKVIAIVIIAIVVAIVAGLTVTKVIIPNNNYKTAVALMDEGKYEEAIEQFESLGEYKDSAEKIAVCEDSIENNHYEKAIALMDEGEFKAAIEQFENLGEYKDAAEQIAKCYKSIIQKAKVGDTIYFGTYEQDNDANNGEENIEWIVLEKKNHQLLVLSKNSILIDRYGEWGETTWAECSLRSWLNGTFLSSAFSIDEQKKISNTTVVNADNPEYKTDGGKNTVDKIFLLSIDEANKYFHSDSDRKATYNGMAGRWWLRSPGSTGKSAAYVDGSGWVFDHGSDVDSDSVGIRPAMWISLD